MKQVLLLLKSSDRISHDLEELSRVAEAIAKRRRGDTESLDRAPAKHLDADARAPEVAPSPTRRRVPRLFRSRLLARRALPEGHHAAFRRAGRGTGGGAESVARFVRRELAPACWRLRGRRRCASSAPPPSSILASSRLVADLYVHASGKVRLVDLAVPGRDDFPAAVLVVGGVFAERERGRGTRRNGEERRRRGRGGRKRRRRTHLGRRAEPPLFQRRRRRREEEEESEEEEANEGGQQSGSSSSSSSKRQRSLPTKTTTPPRPLPRRRRRESGGIAPGRSLYGAPHDFADGECVEALVERLKATEG